MNNVRKIITCLIIVSCFLVLSFSKEIFADDNQNDEYNIEEVLDMQNDESIENELIELSRNEELEATSHQQISTNDIQATDGEAYAVLQNDGDLVFFRSYNSYQNGHKGSFTDIYNNVYNGEIYSGIEQSDFLPGLGWGRYYDDLMNYYVGDKIKRVYVAPNQIITPLTMKKWFSYCTNLTSFNKVGFDTSNVTDMSWMFTSCSSLETLDLSNFNTSNVTNMYDMFSGCSSFESLDLSSFDTSNVEDMSQMFTSCSSLESLDLSDFNTSNVTNMSGMFSGCSSFESLDLRNFNTLKVSSMDWMFRGCRSIETLDLSSFDTSNVSSMEMMFSDCSSLETLDLSDFNTSNVTNMSGMFSGCSSLETLDLSNFNTSNVTDMSNMFAFSSGDRSSVLRILNLSNFNTLKVSSMDWMFRGCRSIETLDLSSFDTSNVSSMGMMFSECSSLKELDLSNFDTSNTSYVNRMFENCYSLKYIDISSFDTSNANGVGTLFDGCSALEAIKLGTKFTKWGVSMLPKGMWVNEEKQLAKNERELELYYPSNAEAWAGTWRAKKITHMTIIPYYITLNPEQTHLLTISIAPKDASYKKLTWSSSDESVATVDQNGLVTAIGPGSSIIVASSNDYSEKDAVCTVIVKELVVPVETLMLYKRQVTLNVEGTDSLSTRILPNNATNKTLSWSSSNPEVATVDNQGNILALSKGNTTITVSTTDGSNLSDTCIVTVVDPNATLDTPQLKSVLNVKNGVDIRFEEVENATSYIIIRIVSNKETIVAEVNKDDIPVKYGYLNWTDTSVKSEYGKGFAYKVIAKDGDNQSEASNQLAIFRISEPTTSKIEVSSGSIKISWNKEKVHRYVLQYSSDGNNWTTIETTATNRNITNLKPNTTYYFRVRGVMVQKDGTIHYSQYSTRKSAKTK